MVGGQYLTGDLFGEGEVLEELAAKHLDSCGAV